MSATRTKRFPLKDATSEKKVRKFAKKNGKSTINRVMLEGKEENNLAYYIAENDYDFFGALVNDGLIDINGRTGLKGENLLHLAIKNNNYFLARKMVVDYKAHMSSKYFRAIWTVTRYGPADWKNFIDFFTRHGEDPCSKPKKRGSKNTTYPVQEAHARSYMDIASYIYEITKGECLNMDRERDRNIKDAIDRYADKKEDDVLPVYVDPERKRRRKVGRKKSSSSINKLALPRYLDVVNDDMQDMSTIVSLSDDSSCSSSS